MLLFCVSSSQERKFERTERKFKTQIRPIAVLTVSDDSLQEVPEHPRGANKHTTGGANKSPGWFKISKKSQILFFVRFLVEQ